MTGIPGFSSLAPKTKNVIVAGGLTSFVFGVYFYTMRAVGDGDELQVAIDKLEGDKVQKQAEGSIPSKIMLSYKGEIDCILLSISSIQSKEINLTLQDEHKVKCAHDRVRDALVHGTT